MVLRNAVSRFSKGSSRSRRSILAPSLLAFAGSGWVSMKIPSAPVAMAARAMVSIISCHTAGCVGLLQRVGAVYYHRALACLLHTGHSAEVYNEVAVAECGAALGHCHIITSARAHFLYCKAH